MTPFQRIAFATTISLIVLIFVGAIVRATGSGMGCPDWPKCWGKLIPPTHVSQIDVNSLPIDKYKIKAQRHGRNPDEITKETVLEEFDPLETWIEYINRLTSIPLGFLTLATLIGSCWFIKQRPFIFGASLVAFALLLINAIMGRNIVYSGLKPGVITTHMALAILMLGVLVFIAWYGRSTPWRFKLRSRHTMTAKLACVLLGLTLIEGIMGSQVRELTDSLQKTHQDSPRSLWVEQLELSTTYLIHRSFSWFILIVTIGFGYLSLKYANDSSSRKLSIVTIAMVLSQMVLGFWISLIGLHPIVQVLHIGLSSILVSALFLWILGASKPTLTSSQ